MVSVYDVSTKYKYLILTKYFTSYGNSEPPEDHDARLTEAPQRSFVAPMQSSDSPVMTAGASLIAAVIVGGVLHPLDLIKTRTQGL